MGRSFHASPAGAAPPEASRPPFMAIGVTLVLVVAAVAGVAFTLKSREAPSMPPEPACESIDRPALEPTGNPELDQLLREAQDSIRGAESNLRRAEEHSRRVEADLAEALARKTAADRAKAEFEAGLAAMRDAPTGM